MNIHVICDGSRHEFDSLRAAFVRIHDLLHRRWLDGVVDSFFEPIEFRRKSPRRNNVKRAK